MQNPKNQLQEFCVKHGLAPPQYQRARVGGPDHAPIFQCSVVQAGAVLATGDHALSATEAEMKAAQVALERLILQRMLVRSETTSESSSSTTTTNSATAEPSTQGKRALLVDVENLPKFIGHLSEAQCRAYDVYAVLGVNHALAERELPHGVTRVLAPSTHRDGADCCMQVYVGYLLARGQHREYVVATHDHFAGALVDMIRTDTLLWRSAEARHVTRTNQLDAA